jgi:hypothetical protein
MHRNAGVSESFNGAFQIRNTSRNTRDFVYDDGVYSSSVCVIKEMLIA